MRGIAFACGAHGGAKPRAVLHFAAFGEINQGGNVTVPVTWRRKAEGHIALRGARRIKTDDSAPLCGARRSKPAERIALRGARLNATEDSAPLCGTGRSKTVDSVALCGARRNKTDDSITLGGARRSNTVGNVKL